MNRKDFEEAVAESGMNPYARFILLTYASHADWKDIEPEVWPGMKEVARITGIHRDTVKDYVDAAVKDGWLIPASMHGRAQGYTLAKGCLVTRQLMKTRGHNNLKSQSLVVPTPMPSGAVSDCLVVPLPMPSDQALITKEAPLEEPKEEPTAVASAPALPLATTKEDEDMDKELLEYKASLDKDQKERYRVLTATWGDRLRPADALKKIKEEEGQEEW